MLSNLKEQTKEFILSKFGISGANESEIDGFSFYTANSINEFSDVLYEPSLCVILQGAKEVNFNKQMYGYGEKKFLLTAAYMPFGVRICKASEDEPYISVALKFSMSEIYEALINLKQINEQTKDEKGEKGAFFGDLSDEILEPLLRLINLLKRPKEQIKYLAELTKKEILYALIMSDGCGKFIGKFAAQGSTLNKISQVVSKIRLEYNQKISVKQLAKICDMSESSFYQNFKIVTSLSPIVFQKQVRLQEAKNLLATTKISASDVAFDVGYESASQFSREYSRYFGISPKRHSEILRQNAG